MPNDDTRPTHFHPLSEPLMRTNREKQFPGNHNKALLCLNSILTVTTPDHITL